MVLNIMMDEKFTIGFIDFFKSNFSNLEIKYVILANHDPMRYCEKIKKDPNVIIVNKTFKSILKMLVLMKNSKGVILNGIFFKELIYLLYFFNLEKKCYWFIYGGDLYSDSGEKKKGYAKIKRKVICKLAGIIEAIPGDYDVAKKKYDTKSKRFYCVGPNALITSEDYISENKKLKSDTINILIGNSADPENDHQYIIDLVCNKIEKNMLVHIPLSYGDKEYAIEVGEYAKKKIGQQVNLMMDFMNLHDYIIFLQKIDIVIYAHKRQQAFSNTVQLLSGGSKIFMDPSSTVYQWLKSIGIFVYDVNTIQKEDLVPLTIEEKRHNALLIRNACSKDTLKKEWEELLGYINDFN